MNRPLDRLERGPSKLASHYMLGLAVADLATVPPRKPLPKPRDQIERIERLLADRAASMTLRDIANEFRRAQSSVYRWASQGVATGRLIIVGRSANNPRYTLPDNYRSQESATLDKLAGYAELIEAHPEGVSAAQAAQHFGVSLRTARRWLLRGVDENRWRRIGYSEGRPDYLFGAAK